MNIYVHQRMRKEENQKHNMAEFSSESIKILKALGIIKPKKAMASHPPYISTMKPEIRRLVKENAKFECEVCGKIVKRAGMFEYRHRQMVIDHIPKLLRTCRVCIYKLSFGSKGSMARKRNNQVEMETPRYTNLD